jgi:hypothetical protein
MDLALAYGVARKLAPRASSSMPGRPARWPMAAACQGAIAGRRRLQAVPVVVPSRGSKLIGGSIRTEVTRDEVLAMLVEGFFPKVAVSDKPKTRARGALTQLGLPYAQDAAVTRHLAAFLSRQVGAGRDRRPGTSGGATFLHPTAILFNGGVLKAPRSSSAFWKSSTAGWPTRARACAPAGRCQPRPGRGARRGLLRPYRGQRPRRAHPRRHGAELLRGRGVNMPAIPGMEPPSGPVPGAVRHGRGHRSGAA